MIIQAARNAGVERIVAMASVGAVLEPVPGMGKLFRACDDLLRESGSAVP